MKKLAIYIPVILIMLSGCSAANTTPHNGGGAATGSNPGSNSARVSKFFMTKPVLPAAASDSGAGAWDISKFSPILNPVPNGDAWQPMNVGEGTPLLASSAAGIDYMATSAGVWYRRVSQSRWTFMPGTEKFTSIVAITVTPSGAPIVATDAAVYMYQGQQWERISNGQEKGIRSLQWTKEGQLAVEVTAYPQRTTTNTSNVIPQGPAPMPIYSMMLFDGNKWTKGKDSSKPGSRERLNPAVSSNPSVPSSIGKQTMGVYFIGQSPAGVPTVELKANRTHRQLMQFTQGQWHVLGMTGFPADKPNVGDFSEVQNDVTWWNGKLTVSSPEDGAMAWNNSAWQSVGTQGMTTNFHRFGDVMTTTNGTLFEAVDESVPAPPVTPRRQFNTLWTLQHGKWEQISFPKVAANMVYGNPIVSPTGQVAIEEDGPFTGNLIWLYQHGRWQEVGNGSGMFQRNHVEEIEFAPNGHITAALVGGPGAASDNLYEWTGSKWTPLFTDNAILKRADWFTYTWAPDGSMIVGLMNVAGAYSVWRYKDGNWTDLGLNGQRPQYLYVTPKGTLFVITDQHVCWRTSLS